MGCNHLPQSAIALAPPKRLVYNTAKVYVQPPPHSPLLWEAGGCFFGLRTNKWTNGIGPLSRPVWRGWVLGTALLGTLMNCLSVCEVRGRLAVVSLPRPFVWGLHLALCLGGTLQFQIFLHRCHAQMVREPPGLKGSLSVLWKHVLQRGPEAVARRCGSPGLTPWPGSGRPFTSLTTSLGRHHPCCSLTSCPGPLLAASFPGFLSLLHLEVMVVPALAGCCPGASCSGADGCGNHDSSPAGALSRRILGPGRYLLVAGGSADWMRPVKDRGLLSRGEKGGTPAETLR